jgi:hypothetical protein
MRETKPCPHMTTLLSALADDSLQGIARWYAQNHAQRCPGCGNALSDLRTLRERIRILGVPSGETLQLSPEHWERLEAAWEEVEKTGT